MKKILFLQALILLCVGHAFAYDFEVDGIYYNKINSDEVSVIHNGHPNSYSGEVSIPSTVSYEEVTYKVTGIGSNAFDGSSNMTSVTIANSVTSIGGFAFFNCSKLSSVTIPNSVESIGSDAFWGCSGLTSITIPNSVTSIGYYAFCNCSGLTSVTIPNSVESIGNYAFWNCTGLTSVTIDNSVESIGDGAFYGCSGLTSVTIPNSVKSIGEYAFSGCSGLKALICQATTPPSMGNNNTFGGKKMIFVPACSISAYKSKWTDFSDYTFASIPTALFTSKQTADSYASDMTSVDKQNTTSVVFAGGIDPSLSISKIKEGMNPNCLYYIYTGDELSGDNVVNIETGEASSIKLTDNCVYNAIRPISADRVEYVHNPSVWANGKSGWETIVLPFEPTDYIASSAGYLAPITLGAQGNFWLRRFVSASSESVFFTSTLDGRMEANVPYLIAFPGETMGQGHLQGQSITFRASNVDLPMTDMPTLKKGAFTFTGNYDTTADDCTGYALDANGASFVETATVGNDPFRAYFQKEGGVAAARQLNIKVATDDMDTEGLIGVVKGEGNASAPYYDLQGRTQVQPKSGLYITNGKKVIVR